MLDDKIESLHPLPPPSSFTVYGSNDTKNVYNIIRLWSFLENFEKR